MAVKFNFLSILFLAIVASSFCHEDSILTKLTSSNYRGFVKLLEHAKLIPELNQKIKDNKFVTILSPNDNFFLNEVSPVLLSWLKMEKNLPILRKVLMNHIIVGKLHEDTRTTVHEKSISGKLLELRNEDGKLFIEGISIEHLNFISAEDGVVHSINGLIISRDVKDKLLSFLDTVKDSQVRDAHYSRQYSSKLETPSAAPSFTSSPSVTTPESSDPPSSTVPPPESPSPSAVSPSDSPSPSGPSPSPSGATSLAEVLSALTASGKYTTLLKYLNLIDQTVLEDALSKEATILAPSDYAFGVITPPDLQYLEDTGRLDDVILYHIIVKYVRASDFNTGEGAESTGVSKAETTGTTYQYPTLLQGYNMNVTVTSDDKVYFGSNKATILDANVLANGQTSVSGLDQVVVPPEFLIRSTPTSDGFFVRFEFVKTLMLMTAIAFFII